MRIDGIATGDIIRASIGGRVVYGEVLEISAGVVHFNPISRGAGWRPRQRASDRRALAAAPAGAAPAGRRRVAGGAGSSSSASTWIRLPAGVMCVQHRNRSRSRSRRRRRRPA